MSDVINKSTKNLLNFGLYKETDRYVFMFGYLIKVINNVLATSNSINSQSVKIEVVVIENGKS